MRRPIVGQKQPDDRVRLNGETIVDADLADHQDKAEKIPGVNRPSGYIGLQNHGKPTEFRNIEIVELTAE